MVRALMALLTTCFSQKARKSVSGCAVPDTPHAADAPVFPDADGDFSPFLPDGSG